MRPVARGALAVALVAAWQVCAVPWFNELLRESRADRAVPLAPEDAEARIALLPAVEAHSVGVRQLEADVAQARILAEAEGTWNRRVAAALTEGQRQHAMAIIDRTAPTPPPPFEAQEADGDVVALVRALLDNYGYVDAELASAPRQDAWPGADRRSRARGIAALAQRHELLDDEAHVILVATLTFLDQQVARARNLQHMRALLLVAMGG